MTRTCAFLPLIMLVGCSTVEINVNTGFDERIKFNQYKTYAWHPEGNKVHPVDFQRATLAYKLIKESVNEQLRDRQLKHTGAETSDLLVRFAAAGKNIKKVVRWDEVDWYGRRTRVPVTEKEYRRGTLVIDIFDRKLNRIIWRSVAIADMVNPDAGQRLIKPAVRKMFKQYPLE